MYIFDPSKTKTIPMNQKFTFTLIAVCIIYLSQSNALLAVSTESYLLNGPLENSVLPVDTPKKKPAPAPAAAPPMF